MQHDHPLKKCFDLLTPSQGSGVCVRSKCLLACYGAPLISLVSMMLLFVCFVALPPKSTAMVIVGRSVHLTTLFRGQA